MARLMFKSGRNFPSWTFTHFLDSFEMNYRKLVIISQVLDLIHGGRRDADFKVALDSPDPFSDEKISISDFDRYVSYVDKGDNYKDFWSAIRNLDRPTVFVRNQDEQTFDPIYRPSGKEGLRVIEAHHMSPFNFTFEGLAEAFNALRFSKRREERLEERHQIEMQKERAALQRKQDKHELNIAIRQLKLTEKIQTSPISNISKQIIAHHTKGIIEHQTQKNNLIDAQIEHDE